MAQPSKESRAEAHGELGVLAHQNMDVVREVLGMAPGLEPIGGEILGGVSHRGKTGLEGDGLACSAGYPVLDRLPAHSPGSAYGTQALTGVPAFEPIVNSEGLGGEGMAAGLAAKARDLAKGPCRKAAPGSEVPVGAFPILVVMAAVWVCTEWGDEVHMKKYARIRRA